MTGDEVLRIHTNVFYGSLKSQDYAALEELYSDDRSGTPIEDLVPDYSILDHVSYKYPVRDAYFAGIRKRAPDADSVRLEIHRDPDHAIAALLSNEKGARPVLPALLHDPLGFRKAGRDPFHARVQPPRARLELQAAVLDVELARALTLALELRKELAPLVLRSDEPERTGDENREEEEVQLRHRAPGSIRELD